MSAGNESERDELAPGWYPDPSGRFELRYHNGARWTGDVASDGRRYVDPVAAGTFRGPLRTHLDDSPGGPDDARRHPAGTPSAPTSTVAAPAPRNGVGVASMVMGIIALAIGWLPFLFVAGAVAAALAIVFGWVGLRRARETDGPTGPSVTGLITGVTGLAAAALGAALTVVVTDALDAFENPRPHEVEITACDVVDGIARTTGEITNIGDDTGSYSIELVFVRPGTDNAQRSGRVEIDDLAAGDTAAFELARAVPLDTVDCRVVSVDGPLPFGLDLGL